MPTLPPDLLEALSNAYKAFSKSPKDAWKPVSIVEMKPFEMARPTTPPYKLGGKPVELPTPANDMFEPVALPASKETASLKASRQGVYLVDENNASSLARRATRVSEENIKASELEQKTQEALQAIQEALKYAPREQVLGGFSSPEAKAASDAVLATSRPLDVLVGPITRTPYEDVGGLSTMQKTAVGAGTAAAATGASTDQAQGVSLPLDPTEAALNSIIKLLSGAAPEAAAIEKAPAFPPLKPRVSPVTSVPGAAWTPLKQEPITAYHASPHDFDKFDMSKVGTGLGHGYVGEGMNFTTSQAKAEAMREQYFPGGKVYKVGLDADPGKMLDIQTRASEQPHIQQLLSKEGIDPARELGLPAYAANYFTGKDVLRALEAVDVPRWRQILNDPTIGNQGEAVRKFLTANGVPGVKNLDQHVIMDDKLINVLKKYGIIGATGAGLAAAATGASTDQAQATLLPPGILDAFNASVKAIKQSGKTDAQLTLKELSDLQLSKLSKAKREGALLHRYNQEQLRADRDRAQDKIKPAIVGGATAAGASTFGGDEAKAQDAWKPVGQQPLEAAPQGAWKPVKQEPLPQDSQWSPGNMLRGAVKPFTSYPDTYHQMQTEARSRMSEGASEIATPGSRASGAWKLGTGALGYGMAPIDAAARTIVGKPIEDLTGIPKEYTEFAAELAIPGVGLTGAGSKGRDAFKPIEAVLSPTTVSGQAGDAAKALRSASGTAARDTAKTEAAIEPFQARFNALPETDRINFIDYVENRTGRYAGLTMRDPELQAAANGLRTAFDQRMTKLQALPSTAHAQFIDDYFPHFWKDPGKAATAATNFGGGTAKQGSGASLKARTVPTIADGLAMGLEPVTTNPLEATLRYVRSMDHFIASQDVLDTAKAQGTVVYARPKVMGASGNPDSFKGVPAGYAPLTGRGATRADGSVAYAPEDWARVYNNFIDRGIHKNADWGKIYDALQSSSNAITGLELGLSGYHAFTVANEAVISGVAKGIGEIVGGKPLKGVGSIALAPLKPVTSAMTGKKMERVYLGTSPGAPNMGKVVDLLEKAGGRAVGKGASPDYRFSAMGSYWTAFKRGALKQEMAAAAQNIRDHPIKGPLQEGARLIGRTMETVAQPLFEKYIPRIKNGAFYDTMHSWLEMNPTASQDAQVKAAQKIWDSIDNRFGEVVQDNIFWNKTLKQSAQLAMRSYSWNLGTVREIAGGAKDIADSAIHGKEWSSRASYVVAMPIVVATTNALYQKLMTGKNPESVDDLIAGRTGGQAPGFGGRGTVDERASLPGYQKDVLGWYENWRQEAANKLATGPRAAVVDPLRDADWKGDPVFHAGTPWLQDYLSHVVGSMGPISVKSLVQGQKTGSGIGALQSLAGIRPAGAARQDPQGYKRGMDAIQRRREQREKRGEQRQQRLYESSEQ